MSDVLNIDVELDDMTIDEIDAVERITGEPLDSFGKAGLPRAALLRALAVVVKHREDPAEYPIGTPDEIAESKRKVGQFRIASAKPDEPAPDAEGNDDEAVNLAADLASEPPATPVS